MGDSRLPLDGSHASASSQQSTDADRAAAEPQQTVDQLPLVEKRLRELLLTGNRFDPVYRHVLASPGKRVRSQLVLACARLLPSAPGALSLPDVVDLACTAEMFHDASLIHDDICDGSALRRNAQSVPAAFGVQTAARAGFHMAGVALHVVSRVLEDNPAVLDRLGAEGVTYHDHLSDLSFGQLVETLPPELDVAALRRHYERVVDAKTGTLFRLACSYGGTAGAIDHDRLRVLMRYADHLALAFQIMDDVRDIEGNPTLGKDACGDLDRRVPTWPVIEWLAVREGARAMWISASTSSADIQTDLVESGATRKARETATRAIESARHELEAFPPTPARECLEGLLMQVISR